MFPPACSWLSQLDNLNSFNEYNHPIAGCNYAAHICHPSPHRITQRLKGLIIREEWHQDAKYIFEDEVTTRNNKFLN